MQKEEIKQVIDNVTLDVSKNINDTLIDNLQGFMDKFEETGTEQYISYSMYFATMTTALKMSIDIMRKSLCELLCDEEADNNATE